MTIIKYETDYYRKQIHVEINGEKYTVECIKDMDRQVRIIGSGELHVGEYIIVDNLLIIKENLEKCKTCKWHDDFSWVCSNGLSDEVADFTDNEMHCRHWEAKDGE